MAIKDVSDLKKMTNDELKEYVKKVSDALGNPVGKHFPLSELILEEEKKPEKPVGKIESFIAWLGIKLGILEIKEDIWQ